MKRFIVIAGVATIALLFFSGLFWFYEARYLVGRASVASQSFSVANSYMFVSPLQAKADGVEKIRVTVFVLNDQGLGVAGKRVVLTHEAVLKLNSYEVITDSFGKAVFDISSAGVGEFYLPVDVDGKILPQKAHLSFH